MINTYNETHLHRTLKEIYAGKHEGAQKEMPVGPYIADILLSDGGIIEIQTGKLSSLAPKIAFFLAEKRRVRVVYPLAVEKFIETLDKASGTVKIKKSPRKLNLISVFKELTKLYAFAADKNFTLEILEIKYTEERTDFGSVEKSDNSRRRFKKTWNKTGKRLEETGKAVILHGKTGWKKLLPPCFRKKNREFTSTDFFKEINELYPKAKRKESDLMLWVYTKMGFFERTGKKGRTFIYKVQ